MSNLMETVGASLTNEYDSVLISCIDKSGMAYTSFQGKEAEDIMPSAFLDATSNIVMIAESIARKHGINKEDFWNGLRMSVEEDSIPDSAEEALCHNDKTKLATVH